MLKLRFERRFASISQFPDIELPNLTIITGPNGSGKTHLLKAILDGAILTDFTESTREKIQSEIKYFDWSGIFSIDQEKIASDGIHKERAATADIFVDKQKTFSLFEQLDKIAVKYGAQVQINDEFVNTISRKSYELLETMPIVEKEYFINDVNNVILNANYHILSEFNEHTSFYLKEIAYDLHKEPCLLTKDDIFNTKVPVWGRSEIFQNSFVRLFVAYRDIWLENQLLELAASKGNTDPFLSENDFIDKYGPAPWDIANEVFSEAGLPFIINAPSLHNFSPYSAVLTKKYGNSKVNFDSLSSGEKIISSFAFCMYHITDGRQAVSKPKILLFDEIDAPLHPSMSKSILSIIEKIIVKKLEIKVIIVTHSPSTVALAPSDSIFVMTQDVFGLQKKTKTGALNALMKDVPILSISFEGRRQVFVESNVDAKIYENIYNIIKSKINSERTLEFISTGIKKRPAT